jgi:hypothetical protein
MAYAILVQVRALVAGFNRGIGVNTEVSHIAQSDSGAIWDC